MQWARAGFFPFDYIHVPSIVFIAIVEKARKGNEGWDGIRNNGGDNWVAV